MNIKDIPLSKLKEIAKNAGAKGYSKLSKSALIEHLRKHASITGGGTGDIATAEGAGDSNTDVSDRLKKLVSQIKGGGLKTETPARKEEKKPDSDDSIDWDDIKWGSFTQQLQQYNKTHKNKFEGENALCKFSDMILSDKSKYSTTTKRRAMFYKNVLAKKKCS